MYPTTGNSRHLRLVSDANALLEAHFAASPTGILIADHAGEVQTYNDRFLQLWGLKPGTAEAHTAYDLLLYMSGQVADCEVFLAALKRIHEDPDLESYGDLIHLANSRTLSCNTRPVIAANGDRLGRVWDYQDVTDVVSSRAELRLARYTLDHTSTPVLWLEENGTIASANRAAAKSLGYTIDKLEQLNVWDLNPDRTPTAWADLWDDIKQAGKSVFEGSQRRSDGSHFPVEVQAHFFRFDTTELVCGFIRDLTESRAAEEERRQLEQSVQQAQKFEGLTLLAGGIAHDFNNLLVGILGNASLALENAGDDPEITTSLEQIRDAGEHATALTHQMLTYAGQTELRLQPLDLSGLVRNTERLLAAGIDKDCHLGCDLSDELPAIEADATQMRQVLVNLVTNASEALRGKRGEVTVTTRVEELDADSIGAAQFGSSYRPGRYVVLEVTDTGIGMDEETVGRVFDPFFSTKLSAHGLGLAAVRGIVHQHHGLLRIDSTLGVGSTFTVLLPASDGEVQVEPQRGPQEDVAFTGHVLLVDDNPAVLGVGRRMLEKLGFTVESFESGAEAVALVEGGASVDLAIVDLTMPEMDGSEVARALRDHAPDLPILLSSGYSELEVVGQSEAGRGVAYLSKPYTVDELKRSIRAALPEPEAEGDDWLA